ncbi:MAG: DUF1080 domain-containing protein [Planctomycetes bacterium]|nr:DUF1080 domain-containing protein [Planctomycetota bacterium]
MKRLFAAAPFAACLFALSLSSAHSDDPKPKKILAAANEKDAGEDFQIQGDYIGMHKSDKVAAQVIAKGEGKFVVNLLKGGLPGDGWDGKTKHTFDAKSEGGKTSFNNKEFAGTIAGGKMTVTKGDENASLERVIRKSSTLNAKPPTGAVVLFDGKSLDHWTKGDRKTAAHWKLLDDGSMQVPGGGDIYSKEKFKDFTLHVEFCLPFMPHASGQGRANSGVYLQDRYEVQVLDSFGLKGLDNECAGIYSQFAPKVNMCFPPLSWQTYDIDFIAARYENEKRIKPAIVTIRHNGVIVHENQEIKGPTGGGDKEEDTPGGIHLQDHGNPLMYRNIWVVEKNSSRRNLE